MMCVLLICCVVWKLVLTILASKKREKVKCSLVFVNFEFHIHVYILVDIGDCDYLGSDIAVEISN